jgi:lysozyme
MKARLAAILLGASLVSVGGYGVIKAHEGLRFTSYPDPATGGAPWTICYGHTEGVTPGMTVSKAQCEQWLREDVAEAEAYLQSYVRVPLNQNEYDAYTSFIFNAGPQNFRTSTMLRLLNAGKRTEACNQFPRWKYANKKVLKGIVKRRYEEQTLCLTPAKEYVYVPH